MCRLPIPDTLFWSDVQRDLGNRVRDAIRRIFGAFKVPFLQRRTRGGMRREGRHVPGLRSGTILPTSVDALPTLETMEQTPRAMTVVIPLHDFLHFCAPSALGSLEA